MDGLLEKLARLGINMIPQAGAIAGTALGGPAGGAAGQLTGSALEQLLSPRQSAFEGGVPVGMGAPMNLAQGQDDRLGQMLKMLGGQGAMAAGNALMGAPAAGSPFSPSDEWISLLMKVLQTVPKDEISKFLESRTKPQGEI